MFGSSCFFLCLQRVEADGDWNLFCPNEAPGLSDTHSDAFKVRLYVYLTLTARGREVLTHYSAFTYVRSKHLATGGVRLCAMGGSAPLCMTWLLGVQVLH